MPPLVTVIVPTTPERRGYNEAILNNFIRQDYISKEILFDHGEGCIGWKRNNLCNRAKGEILIHFDDDDKYADNWISKSVEAILYSGADIVGLSKLNMYDPVKDIAYEYFHNSTPVSFLSGATLCYRREYWERNNFENIQVGEDSVFMYDQRLKIAKIFDHGYVDGFLASIHSQNTSPRQLDNGFNYRMLREEEKEVIVKRFFGSRVQCSDETSLR